MSIQTERQLLNSQRKLKLLEDQLHALHAKPVTNVRTRELTLRSLKGLVNQMKEEITIYLAHRSAPVASS